MVLVRRTHGTRKAYPYDPPSCLMLDTTKDIFVIFKNIVIVLTLRFISAKVLFIVDIIKTN